MMKDIRTLTHSSELEIYEPDEFGHSEVMVADYTMGVFTVEPNTELKGVVKWMEIPE